MLLLGRLLNKAHAATPTHRTAERLSRASTKQHRFPSRRPSLHRSPPPRRHPPPCAHRAVVPVQACAAVLRDPASGRCSVPRAVIRAPPSPSPARPPPPPPLPRRPSKPCLKRRPRPRLRRGGHSLRRRRWAAAAGSSRRRPLHSAPRRVADRTAAYGDCRPPGRAGLLQSANGWRWR